MLTLVATPIGNLNDISLRQAQTIAQADIILAEDTRSFGTLKSAIWNLIPEFKDSWNTSQKVVSYYKDIEFQKLHEVLEWLEDGKDIVQLTESGMPIVSDPGALLVSEVVKRNIEFSVVPGASAVTTALTLSGLIHKSFMFVGFLPKKASDLKKQLVACVEIAKLQKDIVFVAFESPMRISKTLSEFEALIPKAQAAICRELTKKFEEVTRGTPSELLKREYKGEITLVFKLDK